MTKTVNPGHAPPPPPVAGAPNQNQAIRPRRVTAGGEEGPKTEEKCRTERKKTDPAEWNLCCVER